MSKIVAVIVALAVGFILSLSSPATAHDPNDAPCVTSHEAEHVASAGTITRAEVHRIFDFNGSEVWQRDGVEKRHYRHCAGDFYDVWVWYDYNASRDAWFVIRMQECGGC